MVFPEIMISDDEISRIPVWQEVMVLLVIVQFLELYIKTALKQAPTAESLTVTLEAPVTSMA